MTSLDKTNIDAKTVEGFGDEWTRFDQSRLDARERERLFASYFKIFPWERLPEGSVGADIGCGSGRWAFLAARRVGELHLVDASAAALDVARANLTGVANVRFHHASAGSLPVPDASLDFAYSLGVLHHMPDTRGAMEAIARKLKPGAPFLVYLYYAFDNQPAWYRWLWRLSDLGRRMVCQAPLPLRYLVSQAIAAFVYWPLARAARAAQRMGLTTTPWPLAAYADKSFYTMRTDALDRFGTRLEQRFTREQIASMMESAGFGQIRFSEAVPYWCAVGIKGSRN